MEFFRGDTFGFKFQRKANGKVLEDLPNKLFFTVKDNYYTDRVIFQKSLENGITKDEDNWYHVMIKSEDTDGLDYKDYYYDIEVITDTYKLTIADGILKFKKEVTFPSNETSEVE